MTPKFSALKEKQLKQPQLAYLTQDSTLKDLPFYNCQISNTTLGQEIATKFEEQLDLPGIFVTDRCELSDMISRQKFFEWLSQPYSRELCLKREIQRYLNINKTYPLQFSANCKINEAVQNALSRSSETVYEPIIVVCEDQSLRLINFHLLLLAQSQILAKVNAIVKLSELKSRFVSMTSHEFRTPLATILSSTELLEHYSHKWSDEKKLTHFQRIQASVKHMTGLLNDVLLIGKAEGACHLCALNENRSR